MRETIRSLALLRAENKVLSRGRRTTLSSDDDTWVYRMGGCDGASDVVVAINRADTARTLDVGDGPFDDLRTGGEVAGGSVSIGPRSFLVFRRKR